MPRCIDLHSADMERSDFIQSSLVGAVSSEGGDVSSYQGEIDWETLSSQNISFAFIKATEGSSLLDQYFLSHYEQAHKAGLRVGAYHFFSYDSPGETQADHFIASVERQEGMLPPVIDLEFYGDKEKNPPSIVCAGSSTSCWSGWKPTTE